MSDTSPPLWLIGWTFISYSAFLIAFDEQVFQTSFADGFSFGDLLDVIQDLGRLVSFGGVNGELKPYFQWPLFLSISVPWLFLLTRQIQIATPGGG